MQESSQRTIESQTEGKAASQEETGHGGKEEIEVIHFRVAKF